MVSLGYTRSLLGCDKNSTLCYKRQPCQGGEKDPQIFEISKAAIVKSDSFNSNTSDSFLTAL